MQLLMYLGNDLIEAVAINQHDLRVPGYLGKFKRCLKQKYADLIANIPEGPEFLVSPTDIGIPVDTTAPQQIAQQKQ